MSVGILKKTAALAAVILSVAGAGSTAHAGLTYTSGTTGPSAGVIFQNFNVPANFPSPTTLGPASDSITVSFSAPAGNTVGSTPGVAAAPYVVGNSGVPFGDAAGGHLDATQYLTAGNTSITLTFSAGNKYMGLLWGSIDNYNTLTFYDASNTVIGTITGSQVIATPNGDQGVNGSRYVNIYSTTAFTKVVASSTSYAFEFDNVAYAVPEPASLAMSGTALLAVSGLVLRRRKAKVAQA